MGLNQGLSPLKRLRPGPLSNPLEGLAKTGPTSEKTAKSTEIKGPTYCRVKGRRKLLIRDPCL